MKTKDPRQAVFCRCGAHWVGRWVASAAPIIEGHRTRCGPLIPVQTFELLGWKVTWPAHWTLAERAEVRSASLKEATRVGESAVEDRGADRGSRAVS